MGVAAAEATERAYAGASHGELVTHSEDDLVELAIVLRPGVPMGYVASLPVVCALGVVDALRGLGVDAGMGWPSLVLQGGEVLCEVRAKAGYGEGIFCVCSLELETEGVAVGEHPAVEALCDVLAEGVIARVDAWAAAVVAGRASAGPLAPVLSDLFDAMPLMGKPVELVYPNGNVALRGTFVGVDVWNRATVRNALGADVEVAPEQVSMRPVR